VKRRREWMRKGKGTKGSWKGERWVVAQEKEEK
jgi:hypothetical protein